MKKITLTLIMGLMATSVLAEDKEYPAIKGIYEAYCSPQMDDECEINRKPVPKADLIKYLPLVVPEAVEDAGGSCDYPICYNKDEKPIGLRYAS